MPSLQLESILDLLALDPHAQGLQLVPARELAADAFPRIDTDRPALVLLDKTTDLAAITRTLVVNYPYAHPVTLVRGKHKETLPLSALAQAKPASVIYIGPLPYESSPLTLANIMSRLRAPDGCPWDQEQTHESITRALVEETYEVIEAISDNDMPHLKEELGDLLLHVLFQTQIARDENQFRLSDVGAELAAKLIRRHPHVFGDEKATDAAWVLQNWDKIKQQEKKQKGEQAPSNTLDAGIPRDLPALTRAQKVTERARRKKLPVPDGALEGAVTRKLRATRKPQRGRVLGDLFLELAALAEAEGLDAEGALNAATKRFVETKKE